MAIRSISSQPKVLARIAKACDTSLDSSVAFDEKWLKGDIMKPLSRTDCSVIDIARLCDSEKSLVERKMISVKAREAIPMIFAL